MSTLKRPKHVYGASALSDYCKMHTHNAFPTNGIINPLGIPLPAWVLKGGDEYFLFVLSFHRLSTAHFLSQSKQELHNLSDPEHAVLFQIGLSCPSPKCTKLSSSYRRAEGVKSPPSFSLMEPIQPWPWLSGRHIGSGLSITLFFLPSFTLSLYNINELENERNNAGLRGQ